MRTSFFILTTVAAVAVFSGRVWAQPALVETEPLEVSCDSGPSPSCSLVLPATNRSAAALDLLVTFGALSGADAESEHDRRQKHAIVRVAAGERRAVSESFSGLRTGTTYVFNAVVHRQDSSLPK